MFTVEPPANMKLDLALSPCNMVRTKKCARFTRLNTRGTATARWCLRPLLWPTTSTKKISIPTRSSMVCMGACKVAPGSTLQVSAKNKLVGTERSVRRSLGPT